MTNPTPGLAPSQTVGPFFLDCLLRPDARRNRLVPPGVAETIIRIEGRVLDGDGVGVPDAVVEIWQANSQGEYAYPADTKSDSQFIGFGRSGTDEAGHFWFETIGPGAVPMSRDDTRMQAPHICVIVHARGLLNHLVTRLYFSNEPANERDPVLQRVPEKRRGTLIAEKTPTSYQWNIILQGAGETVFFNL